LYLLIKFLREKIASQNRSARRLASKKNEWLLSENEKG
jgi:hypothetical protein